MHRVAPESEFAAAPPTAPRAESVAADTPDSALLRLVRALAVQAAREAFAAVTRHAGTETDSSRAVS
jgi:hypothetical protein